MGLSQQDIEWARSAGFQIPGEKIEQPNLPVQTKPTSLSQDDIEWARSAGFKVPEIVTPPESVLSKLGGFLSGKLSEAKQGILEEQESIRAGGRTGPLGIIQTPEEQIASQTPSIFLSDPLKKQFGGGGATAEWDQFGSSKTTPDKGILRQSVEAGTIELAKLVEGLLTPENVGYMATGGIPGVGRAVATVFVPGLFKGTMEGAGQTREAVERGDIPEAVAKGLSTAAQALFTVGAGKHAAGKIPSTVATKSVPFFKRTLLPELEAVEKGAAPPIHTGAEIQVPKSEKPTVPFKQSAPPEPEITQPALTSKLPTQEQIMRKQFDLVQKANLSEPEFEKFVTDNVRDGVVLRDIATKNLKGEIAETEAVDNLKNAVQPIITQKTEFLKKTGKIDKTGFTPEQKTYFAAELKKAGDKLLKEHLEEVFTKEEQIDLQKANMKGWKEINENKEFKGQPLKSNYVSKEGVTIKVPGDGTFLINSPEGASTIHKKITGEPIKGIAIQKEQISRKTYSPYQGADVINQIVENARNMYGDKAHETLSKQIEPQKDYLSDVELRRYNSALKRLKPSEVSYIHGKKPSAPAFIGGAGMKTKMEPTAGKPIGTWDIIRHLEKDYDVPLRIGKYNTRAMDMKAAGIYKGKPEVVRLADAKDITSAAHEIGHHIDKTYFGGGISTPRGEFAKAHWNKEPLKQFRKELGLLDYDQNPKTGLRPYEGFAEYLRHRLSTSEATTRAPEFHKWFNDFLEKNPKLKESLSKSEQLFTQWANQGAEARIKGQIDIEGKGAPETFIDKLHKGKRAFQAAFIDDLQVLDYMTEQMLGKQASKELGEKYPSKHPYKLAIASAKTATAKAYNMAIRGTFDAWGNPTGKGLKDILKPVSKDIDSFLAYAYARRAVELHGRGINPGVTLQDAKYVYDKYNSVPQYAEAAKEFTGYFDRILDYYAEAGGLSAKQKELIREKNQYYIPLKRVFDDKIGGGGLGGKSFVDQANAIKRIKGSGRAIVNPIHSALEMTTKIINASDKLRVINSLIDLAEKTEGAGWIAEKVPTPKVPIKLKTETLLDAIAKEKGVSRKDIEMSEIEMALEDIDQLVTFEPGQSYYGKDNIVAITRNGKREFWQLDPELYRSMKGMDVVTIGPWLKIVSPFTHAVRLGSTGLRVSFSLIKNPIRDMWSYMMQSEGFAPNPFKWFKGLKSVFARDENYRRWQRAGGEIAQPLGLDKKSFKVVTDKLLAHSLKDKSLNIVKHPIEALKDIFGVMEAPARVAEMSEIGGKFEKGSPDSAIAGAVAAADVTVNFKRMGRIGAILNQIIPFWNPSVQGPSKFGKTIKEHPGRSAMRVAATITAPMLALWFMNKDEEWYKETPRWEKLLFMHFNVGTKEKPTIMRLPLPFEWGILFGSLPVAYLDSEYNKNPDAFKEAIGMTAEQFTPDILPAVVKPGIEVSANYDFFKKRPIVPFSKQFLPPEEQYSKYTTETAKELGQQIGVSPIKIEHLVAGHTGGMGLDLIKFIEDGYTNMFEELKIKEVSDIPFIGTLFSRQEDAGQSVEDYYDSLEKARQSHNAVNQYKKERKLIPIKYLEGQKPYKRLYHYYEPLSEALKDKNYQKANELARKALNRETP